MMGRRRRVFGLAWGSLVAVIAATGCSSSMQYAGEPSTADYAPRAYPDASVAGPSAELGGVIAVPDPKSNTETYKDYGINPAVDPAKDPLSTFAIDVDTASYSISRRKIMEGALPPYQAVRAEEFLNSFDYGYAAPASGSLFGVAMTAAPSPFQKGHHLVRIGLQTKRIGIGDRKPVHLVYLVDTSGSMADSDKLPLAKRSLKMLTESMKKGDTIALCTYAGSVREVLAPTSATERDKINAAIDDLDASGSTAMQSGLDLAYELAARNFVAGDTNRVIVLSDGDANVGSSNFEDMLRTISAEVEKGVTLSTIGFGQGNYRDTNMEQLADKGNGNYSYIDGDEQAKRVFSEQVNGLLEVVAKDVKVQVEWDPKAVESYRLIGYENRDIADKDFRNDKVDAGEVGAGHSVTAMYDVVLKSGAANPLKLHVRYKAPEAKKADAATEVVFAMSEKDLFGDFTEAPANFRFASAVAEFAEILRHSPLAKDVSFTDVEKVARSSADDGRDQQEFVKLVGNAHGLAGEADGRQLAVAK
ncbi:MAG: von Willebrand factor type A domain-containing protein [Polyangiaceae bacterium]